MGTILSQERAPLFEELQRYSGHPLVPFHTPGHKGGRSLGSEWQQFQSLPGFDLSEISGIDWAGSLERAEALAAEFYRADRSCFLTQGASQGIIGGILGAFSPGDTVLVGRNCHASVIHALVLADLTPVYLEVEFGKDWGQPVGIKTASLVAEIQRHPDFKGLIITNPTYQGVAGKPGFYRELIGDRILFVDEAHGGHLEWSGCGPGFDARLEADLWVQGTHKILGSLTQTGMLHLRKQRIDEARIQRGLEFITTTSPSYLLLASLDSNRRFLAQTGKQLFREKRPAIQEVKEQLDELKGVTILTGERVNDPSKMVDPWKISFSFNQAGISGYEANAILENQYQIQAEYADLDQVTCFISPWQDWDDVERLSQALRHLVKTEGKRPVNQKMENSIHSIPPRLMKPRAAALAPNRTVVLDQSVGRVSAAAVIPYPPGVPLIAPGELIREEEVHLIKEILRHGGIVRGVNPRGDILTIVVGD
jgi:arginine decarboxylase